MARTALLAALFAFWFAAPGSGQTAKPAPADALTSLRQRAERGDAHAQVELGLAYDRGRGVNWNHAEALRWYRKAAAQGDAEGQVRLGVMYEEGRGMRHGWDEAIKRFPEAIKWYRLSADQGNAEAQTRLGLMIERGVGIQRDSAEAIRWYLKAARQSYADAEYRLGSLIEFGADVEKDHGKAIDWYRRAAGHGSHDARFALGRLYFAGEHAPRDFDEAARWYHCPKPSREILAGCSQISLDDLPPGAEAAWEKAGCDAVGDAFGGAVDLNGDGSPEYLLCCHDPPHGACNAVLIGKVETEWRVLNAEIGGLFGFARACSSTIVLESQRGGFHDICLPDYCAPGTGIGGTDCEPMIWRYAAGRYHELNRKPPKPPAK